MSTVLRTAVWAGECVRSMTEARAKELEGLGRQ
jgi:hypothetical protein